MYIYIYIYNNWSPPAASSILECAMCEIQRNQSNLLTLKIMNKGHVIEITNAYIVAFMKARNSLFF